MGETLQMYAKNSNFYIFKGLLYEISEYAFKSAWSPKFWVRNFDIYLTFQLKKEFKKYVFLQVTFFYKIKDKIIKDLTFMK